jgi:hypothetical protein
MEILDQFPIYGSIWEGGSGDGCGQDWFSGREVASAPGPLIRKSFVDWTSNRRLHVFLGNLLGVVFGSIVFVYGSLGLFFAVLQLAVAEVL